MDQRVPYIDENEENLNSFQGDYEPGLEFDDSEIRQRKHQMDDEEHQENDCLAQSSGSNHLDLAVDALDINGIYLHETQDDLLAEHFLLNEDPFMSAASFPALDDEDEDNAFDDYDDIAKHGIVEVAGDDKWSRKVIVIYACRLPNNKSFNHNRFLRYLTYTLDQFVESDYTLVYFHAGLSSSNKPPLSWLWSAFRAFDRKYKKNLKALYLVQPTSFIRIVLQIFKPVMSVKFGRKIHYITHLAELNQHLHIQQLMIPKQVIEHDKKLSASTHKSWFHSSSSRDKFAVGQQKLKTQQFQVSLQFLRENNPTDPIPRVVSCCLAFLSTESALQTEGIFRRSANVQTVKEVQQLFNTGKQVHFSTFGEASGVHVAAATLKSFLRELDAPLLTFDLYEDVIDFQQLTSSSNDLHHEVEKLAVAKSLICQRLPEENYVLLKEIVSLLVKVMDRSDLNKMTASNLAIVFGPNLLWSRNTQASLTSITNINHFTEFLFTHHDLIFVK